MTLQQIADAVCKYKGFPVELVSKKGRKRHIATVRFLCIYLMKKHTTASLREIGIFFDGRDHTTMINAIKTITKLRETDDEINKDIAYLDALFRIENGDIEEVPCKDLIKTISTLLSTMPDYEIAPCCTFGELSEHLSPTKKIVKINLSDKPLDRESFTNYSNKTHVA